LCVFRALQRVTNEDANWDKKNSGNLEGKKIADEAFVTAQTFKTHFEVTTFMQGILENGVNVHISPSSIDTTLDKIQFEYDVLVAQGQNHLSKNWDTPFL
jgi:maltose phosphorylase